MKLFKNTGLPVLLACVLLLSACGGTTGGSGEQPDSNSSSRPGGNASSDANNADIMEGVIDYGFIKDSTYTFDKEVDGYSCQVTVETWQGKQGANDQLVYHPADPNAAIPLASSQDCIVPFAATIRTTTEQAQFLTDIHIAFRTGDELYKPYSNTCKVGLKEEVDKVIERYQNQKNIRHNWNNTFDYNYRLVEKTETGDETVVYGYCVFKDTYSPTNPEGDIPPEALSLLVNVGFSRSYPISEGGYDGEVPRPADAELSLHIEQ